MYFFILLSQLICGDTYGQSIININNTSELISALSLPFTNNTILEIDTSETLIINESIPSIFIYGVNVTLTCSPNNECLITLLHSNSIFDLSLFESYASFTFTTINFNIINTHQDIILINGNSNVNNGDITLSFIQLNSGRIVHENINITLKLSNVIYTQSHPYTINNWEDYEDNIPEKGGFIFNEVSGSILIEYSYLSNCAAIEGGCIFCEECQEIQIYNSTFINGISFEKGGNIYAEKTNVIIGNSYFKYGVSIDEAGCLLLEDGDLLNIYNTQLIGCIAVDAGGLIAQDFEALYFTNLIIRDCIAHGKGGGMRIKTHGIINNILFINNSAGFNGGAFHFDFGNDGTNDGDYQILINNGKFYNNTADYAGGAIHVETGLLYVNNSVFKYNYSPNGGAASITAEIASMYYAFENSIFEQNYAIQGGALWILYGSYFLYNCSCKYNDAKQNGGCIMDINPVAVNSTYISQIKNSYISYNSATISGGGVFFSGTILNIYNNIFEYNIVYGGGGGGALTISKGELYSSNNKFIYNSAVNGGAIYLTTESKLIQFNLDIINNNNAILYGGGIYGEKIFDTKQEFIIYKCKFKNNIAISNGGAIYLQDSSQKIFMIYTSSNPYNEFTFDNTKWSARISHTLFLENDIYAIYLSLVDIQMYNNTFLNNNNGAVFIDAGIINDYNSTFINNTKHNGCGGAIEMINTPIYSLNLQSTIFKENIANNGGAICFDACPQTNLNVSNVLITNNIAFTSGGAVQFESNENIKCDWCQSNECNINNNLIVNEKFNINITSSFSSDHSSWNIITNFDNGSEIDSSFIIVVSVQLFDSYGQKIEYQWCTK